MKSFFTVLLVMGMLSGCTTVSIGNIDAAIQKTAPQACQAIEVGYTAFVATQLGSEKDKTIVASAYSATRSVCSDPSHATSTQVAVLAVQLGVIVNTMRKVKKNG